MSNITSNEPLVTIGMSFHNESAHLELAIRSILSQTYRNWELLLWDDGSTDESLEIARSFQDSRINVFADKERRALSTRMNACIQSANGRYFARMDADDISYPDRLTKQVCFLQQHRDVDLLSAQVAIIDPGGRLLGKMVGPTEHQDIIKRALLGFRMIHPTWIGKIEWFRHHLYRPEAIYAQDQDLLYRAHRESTYAVIPEILLAWRQDQLTVSKLMRARTLWMRHVSRYLPGVKGLLLKASLAALLTAKATVDVAAVASGLGYKILRHRALPLTDAERSAYNITLEKIQYLSSGISATR